ncbi:MAG: hypothetical protein AAF191_04925 [Verrucomicrobiota bacterium]
MSDTTEYPPPGFTLESADSVRFGDDYNPEERERNRQIMVGEALSGLLLGEPIWTNAVFAFDSIGMVELLGAVSRAFANANLHFVPLRMSVYPADQDTFTNSSGLRQWESFQEILLRAYANRLRKARPKDRFILSALPELNQDICRRRRIAGALKKIAGSEWDPSDIPALKCERERQHFANLWAIDRFLRVKTKSRTVGEERVAFDPAFPDTPIRKNQEDWRKRYRTEADEPSPIESLKGFAGRAVAVGKDLRLRDFDLFRESVDLLTALSRDEEAGKISCFQNRSIFRRYLVDRGCSDQQYRVLVELVDAQYTLTQYSELAWGGRDVTSPASDDRASQIGEFWAQAVTNSLRRGGVSRSFEFVNRIEAKAAVGSEGRALDMDKVFQAFSEMMATPEKRSLLLMYHGSLHQARNAQEGPNSDHLTKLSDHTHRMVDMVNEALRTQGIVFDFNSGARTLFVQFRDAQRNALKSGGGLLAEVEELEEGSLDEEERRGSTNCDC